MTRTKTNLGKMQQGDYGRLINIRGAWGSNVLISRKSIQQRKVGLPHTQLNRLMEISNGQRTSEVEPTPDQGTDTSESKFEGVYSHRAISQVAHRWEHRLSEGHGTTEHQIPHTFHCSHIPRSLQYLSDYPKIAFKVPIPSEMNPKCQMVRIYK